MKSPPTSDERELLRTLIRKQNDVDENGDPILTEWEMEFLPSLNLQLVWSEKQREVLDNIWKRVME